MMAFKLDDVVPKIAGVFSIKDYESKQNASLTGGSGVVHKFDIILQSKTDENVKAVALIAKPRELVNDLMLLNSSAEDCGINLKAVVVEKEMDETESNLASIYHISIINPKLDEAVVPKESLFGVKGLDHMINGVMKKGNVYMISGKAGAGKTTSCTHFLVQGAKIGEKGAIILSDMRPSEFINNAKTFSFGFEKYYNDGLIEVMELSDKIRELKQEILDDPKNYRKFITKLTTEIKKAVVASDIVRLAIDPITPMLVENDDFVNIFFNTLAMDGVYVIVTSGLRKSDVSVFGIEEYYVSGIIKLEMVDGNNYLRKASIVKMRGGVYDPKPFSFKITSNGIVAAGEDEISDGSILKHYRA
jgi:circadian clock protein KaiC